MTSRRKGSPGAGEPSAGQFGIAWTERARRDLMEIGDFIARDKPGAARDWVRSLVEAVDGAARMPFAGRLVPELRRRDVREVFRGSYRIVYHVREREIVVLTVFDGRRLLGSALEQRTRGPAKRH